MTNQVFPFTYFEDETPPELQQISPAEVTYTADNRENGFSTATYSGRGDVTAQTQAVDVRRDNCKSQGRCWGAEEFGLLGSEYYVANIEDRDFEDIVANLNFDIIASPNYVRFVHDGDGSVSEEAGPEGSAFIEWLFTDYFMDVGLASKPTAFDGRSDYGPFIENGIPAGGLFTGAEGVKSEEEAGIYDGTAGEAYDPCYHQACDSIDNISLQGLDEMVDAVAYAVNVLAVNDLPQPVMTAAKRSAVASGAVADMMFDYRGDRLQR